MPAPPDASVIIPSRGRPAKAAACVRALADQTLDPSRYEVLVGLDGPDAAAAGAIRGAWPAARAVGLTVEELPRAGQASVRNALLKHARGRVLVFLNDDVVPERGLLNAHLAAHDGRGSPALVLGDAPWVVHGPDRLFDRLLRETSMVFFYDRMRAVGADRERDWGFRHAWLLNLSAPAGVVRELGGFTVFSATYGYEDDEFAWRAAARFGAPVQYRPEAVAHHDHRMEPAEYLERERRLGFAAWGFAKTAPECARAMLGRDIATPGEIAYSREFVRREESAAGRIEESFLALADISAGAVDGPHAGAIVRMLYEQHLLLKRWHWRRGLLEAAGEEAVHHRGAEGAERAERSKVCGAERMAEPPV